MLQWDRLFRVPEIKIQTQISNYSINFESITYILMIENE